MESGRAVGFWKRPFPVEPSGSRCLFQDPLERKRRNLLER